MSKISPYFFNTPPLLPNIIADLNDKAPTFDLNQRRLILKACTQIYNNFFSQDLNETIQNLTTLNTHSAEDIERMIKNAQTFLTHSYFIRKLFMMNNCMTGIVQSIDAQTIQPTAWEEEGALMIVFDETMSLFELLQHADDNKMITLGPTLEAGLLKATVLGLERLKKQYYGEEAQPEDIASFTL